MTGAMDDPSSDWMLGKPPCCIAVRAWIRGHVRCGRSDGVWFHFSDCVHPMQNAIVDIDSIDAWRIEEQKL